MRGHWLGFVAAVAAPLVALALPGGAPAHASPVGVLVFPGMEVHQDTNLCTLGYIDPQTRTAYTAGHCRGSGPVTDRDGNVIGIQGGFQDNTPDGMTIATDHLISDWETIQLAPTVAVNSVLPGGRQLVEDRSITPQPGLPVCHFGVITGESCGTIEAVNNGWFTMAHGVVSQKGDSGGPVYVQTSDGRAAIVGMFNSTWGTYPAAVSWQSATQQAGQGIVQAAGSVAPQG